ncbi:MAG: MBL fold metallo-hydrolase [Alphaproteobacteria bacterium]|nr:MBL fold metallo-hydrolase [Alphaproteobacteria bacterium]
MAAPQEGEELIFVPLGGAGEIGMNLNLYGYGTEARRQFIMVDLGVMFGDDETPGIEVIMPDPSFIEERRHQLLAIVLTHAHEDHIGAVAHLWPRLRVPVYATPFTAALVRGKLAEQGLLDEVPLKIVPLGGELQLGPFSLEFIDITHSIPEPNCIAIRTPLGTVLHTGDWKIDPQPMIGRRTDVDALRRLGEEGVLAAICDSTNVFVPGRSGSEAEVASRLEAVIAMCKGRVAVTAFASNVARLQSIVRAGAKLGRHVALVGRSMHKITSAAIETGYLKDLPAFIDEVSAANLPPARVLYVCTGSQGEPRAALARIAAGEHSNVTLGPGDAVIFSSRVIPGNEKAIHTLQNDLSERGVEVISAEDHDVHVSGHPARDELADMYSWLRPRVAVPVHGERRHLAEHVRLAKSLQIPEALLAPNGSIVRLAPGAATIIDEAPHGRLMLDGTIVTERNDITLKQRRALSFAGHIAVTVVLDERGRVLLDPVVIAAGVPEDAVESAQDAAADAVDRLSGRRMEDDRLVIEEVRRAVRRAVQDTWGKRSVVQVEVARAG